MGRPLEVLAMEISQECKMISGERDELSYSLLSTT
jgi:hypothetical protein